MQLKRSGFSMVVLALAVCSMAAEAATGVVFHDQNNNGKRDDGEKGIAGVKVSNGEQVVLTDSKGRYTLPVQPHMLVFVSKPSGWNTPLDKNNHPRFSYFHSEKGSPKLTYKGMSPTGPIPASIDFPLIKGKPANKYKVLLFGDTQPYTIGQVDQFSHEIAEQLVGNDALFGVTLGDVVGDMLMLHPAISAAHAIMGTRWHFVPGNHDRNYDAGSTEYEYDFFKTQYGPTYYSFDEGKAHFIVLEDIDGDGKTGYNQGIGPKQLAWLKNDLRLTPKDRLVVLMMHIPLLEEVKERKEILEAIAPFKNTISFGAHWHSQEHGFLGKKQGWPLETPHQSIVVGTTCGCWWGGEMDETGLPMALMADGTPQGWIEMSVDGTNFKLRYQVSRRPSSYQMNITVKDGLKSIETKGTEVVANLFLGSPKSKVEMKVDNGNWAAMTREERTDVNTNRIIALEKDKKLPANGRKIGGSDKSPHIWVGKLPFLAPGTHTITVKTTDVFGQAFESKRSIRVIE